MTTLEQLQTDLLADYKKVRPVLNWTETVDVQVMFSLYQVKSLVSNDKFSFALVNCALSYQMLLITALLRIIIPAYDVILSRLEFLT